MNFGQAIEALKLGSKVARAGWNGKGMWLAYSPGSIALPAERFWAPPNRAHAEANGGTANVLPCITMKTAAGEILMGWLASQTDMLANDWDIVVDATTDAQPSASVPSTQAKDKVPHPGVTLHLTSTEFAELSLLVVLLDVRRQPMPPWLIPKIEQALRDDTARMKTARTAPV